MKRALVYSLLSSMLLAATALRASAVTFTVDPAAGAFDAVTNPTGWNGYMNVFELPSNGGGFVFGSPWGTADLTASFAGPTLTLGPNTIGDPNPFWYTPSGGPGATGNKIMEANFYREFTNGSLAGQSVTFQGKVLTNTLVAGYSVIAFIKDFEPGYATNVLASVPLTAAGDFSVTLDTISNPARPVQFGFAMTGPNVWITDVGTKGLMTITAAGAAGVTGDYNNNGTIDAPDYTAWKNAFGTNTALPNLSPTKVGTTIDASDYTVWRDKLPAAVAAAAAVPEPSLWAWMVVAGATFVGTRRRSA